MKSPRTGLRATLDPVKTVATVKMIKEMSRDPSEIRKMTDTMVERALEKAVIEQKEPDFSEEITTPSNAGTPQQRGIAKPIPTPDTMNNEPAELE